MNLPPPPPMSGTALKALVAAAESPASAGLVLKLLSAQMGIAELMAIPCDEPHPLDARPKPFAGREVRREPKGEST